MSRRTLARFAIISLSAGCFRVTSVPTCEELERRPVSDTELTPAGTAADLLAMVAIDARWPGVWYGDGTATDVDVWVTGDGQAEWVEQQAASEETRSFGFGKMYLAMAVSCPNHLSVPVSADVSTPDGALAITASGPAILNDPTDSTAYTAPGVPLAFLTGAYGSATLPAPQEDPSDFDDKYTFVNLTYDEVGFVDGTAGWGGGQETDDYSSWLSEPVVDFATDEVHDDTGITGAP
jgi:hypothetical protein